jgi:hypothetical protein
MLHAALLLMLGARTTVTPFHHQPEAQHLKSSAIHKLPADYPIFVPQADSCTATKVTVYHFVGAHKECHPLTNAVQAFILK